MARKGDHLLGAFRPANRSEKSSFAPAGRNKWNPS